MSVVYQTTCRSFFAASISVASAASAAALAREAITIKSNVNAGRWIGIASPQVRSGLRRRTSRARSLLKRTLIDWENLSQSDVGGVARIWRNARLRAAAADCVATRSK